MSKLKFIEAMKAIRASLIGFLYISDKAFKELENNEHKYFIIYESVILDIDIYSGKN